MRCACDRLFLASAASAAFLAIVPAAAAQTPAEIIEGWIAEVEQLDWLGVSHGGIEHDTATGLTTVTDLAITIEISDLPGAAGDEPDSVELSYDFRFPGLVFEGLGTTGDHYEAAAIQADLFVAEFRLESDRQGSSTSTSSYRGFAASNPRWARLPEVADDPQRPISRYYPLAAALVDISFDEAVFDRILISTVNDEPEMVTTMNYGPGRIGRTERGNISAMEIGEIEVITTVEESDGGSPGDALFSITIGGMEADTYNYGDMVRLFDPALEPGTGAEPFEQMSALLSVHDWTGWFEGGEFTIADLRMEDIGGRRPSMPLLSRADEIYLAVQEGIEPDPAEIAELVAAFYGAFSLGLAEMSGLSISIDEYQGSIDAVGIADLSAEGIASFYYRGIEASDGNDMHARLGDFTISDLGFPLLSALIAFEEAQETGDIDTMLAAMPTLGGISISDLVIDVPFLVEMSLARASIEMSGHIGPIPTRIRTLVDSLHMPTWMLDDDSFEVFDGLGYDDLGASHELDLAWQEEDETVRLASSTTVEDGGTMTLNARLGGLPREAFEDPMSAPFLMFMLTLHEATAEFVDNSLTARALTMFGAQQGTDAQTMRAQALGILPFVLATLQRPDFLMSATAAANAFFDNPGTLRIDMRPDEPVPIVELMEASESDPGMVVDLLNIVVTAE